MLTRESNAAIEALVEKFSGNISVRFKDIHNQTDYCLESGTVRPTASTIKLYILGAMMEQAQQGMCKLSDRITVKSEVQVGGSGVLKDLLPGIELTICDIATLMIVFSDNTATNMMIDLIGGIEAVNKHIKNQGLQNSELRNRINFMEIGDDIRRLGVSTADDFIIYLEKLACGYIFDEDYTRATLNILSKQHYLDLFPRYLDHNPYATDLNMEQGVKIMNKTGFFPGVRCDVGLIELVGKHYAYAVLSDNCADLSFHMENEASMLIGKIGRILYDSIEKDHT
ncbi:serine hydrolase [Paenibacillus sp. 7124]|uniref:Serine hydrolase n=1 Tax=Paenibacillus apii TaxID=1850370 RepID=A0A6M1PT92_9BACL|nr:serine hydrolase [Paenibacillus apii]NGM85262.1 serine hydrolase [Paenibacillus apii]